LLKDKTELRKGKINSEVEREFRKEALGKVKAERERIKTEENVWGKAQEDHEAIVNAVEREGQWSTILSKKKSHLKKKGKPVRRSL